MKIKYICQNSKKNNILSSLYIYGYVYVYIYIAISTYL